MKYSIHDYSAFDNYTYRDSSDHFPSIKDKLIRLTAKLTERFASDICYELDALQKCEDDKAVYDKILLFWENGVNSYPVNNGVINIIRSSEEIQWWSLGYDPETHEAWLKRVDLRKVERVEP